jgi:hypothetical protein
VGSLGLSVWAHAEAMRGRRAGIVGSLFEGTQRSTLDSILHGYTRPRDEGAVDGMACGGWWGVASGAPSRSLACCWRRWRAWASRAAAAPRA